MSTKAFAVKRALRDVLTADPGLKEAKAQTTYGFPTRKPESRWAYVGGVTWANSEWVTNRSRAETFTVRLILNVQVRDTPEKAENLLESLARGVENALAANPSLNGLCVSTSFTPRRVESWPIENATEGQLEAEVTCQARP